MTQQVPDQPTSAGRRALDAAGDALRFFTRLPVPAQLGSGGDDMAGVAAAAPLAGAAVGAGAGLVLALGLWLRLPELAASIIAVAAGVALSGALHLDGLADVADGFGGGRDRDAKLAIMRDSRLGTYGGAALALALMLESALVAGLAERLSPAAAGALIAAAMLARPLAFLPTLTLSPARADGLGRAARPPAGAVAIGLGVAALVAVPLAGLLPALIAIGVGVAAAAGVALLARGQIGGYTGDVCGAAAALAEIAALGALVAAAGLR